MTRRTAIIMSFIAIHLVITGMSAIKVRVANPQSFFGYLVGVYGCVSGTDNHYGFFAPEVGNEARAEMHFVRDGKQHCVELSEGFSLEARLRAGTIVDTFGLHDALQVRRALVESWGGWFLSKNPDIAKVRIAIKYRVLPTMSEYQNGERAEWKEAYSITVSRQK